MIRDIDKRIGRALAGVRQVFRGIMGGMRTDGPVALTDGMGLAGENLPDIELFQHYGFTSHPPPGTMMIVAPVGGKTSHGVVIATEHGAHRVKMLKTGEVAIYTDEGDSMTFARGRIINVVTQTLNIQASVAVNIEAPIVNLSHKLNVKGQITGQGGIAVSGGDGVAVDGGMKITHDVEISGKSFLGHKHPRGSDGITGEPI